ncbi:MULTISPECIES: MaoC/PaaZ C-terminal domain-containing protein [unclassified Streptomyces]|uniref:MaoC family dehydratase n=1 Tax=unclassified Streptomyces TaxID=2593676 RepID=UPI002E820622|nr:MaoC/PaaZ C-terminal domain-containing protein [Streptomyces sp. NBC_00589]WTI37118.1 MaoC/PaaZ C-terminal domain-containing protein [Streptomyces sp. NBC_00775]WUB29206.1 MaoC/PaaZ C-terminal domain-containing protein [Streptomyces sp. NBC_00589]
MADRYPGFTGTAERPSHTLAAPPSLTPLLARGALLSPLKHPRPNATVSPTRLVLPDTRVDLARLAAYERVCGFATGADALPVTYPHILGFPVAMRIMASRRFPLPLLGLVHTSIEITQWRELAATAAYELTVYVEGLTPHRRGTEATVATEARVDGSLVWESRSTYLARHRRKCRDIATEAPAIPQEPGDTNPLPALPTLTEWRLSGDVGRRYAAASGDRNPIHLHPLTARLFGFPRAIAHGMWTVARCLAEYGPRDAVTVRAAFKAPVLLPGTVTYAAEGSAFELRGGDRVHLTGEVRPLPVESG